MNALIVGAEPNWLTTALELTSSGIFPENVDAKKAPSTLSRAVGILPKSIAMMNHTSVGNKLVEAGVEIKRENIYRDGKRLIDIDISKLIDLPTSSSACRPVIAFGLRLVGWLISNIRFFKKPFVKNVTQF